MIKQICLFAGFLLILAEGQANAQGDCASYVGQTIAPQSFERAFAGFTKLVPKGEFETTAQYEARKGSSIGSAAGTLIISKAPEDRKYFEYDADAQKLRILREAFSYAGFSNLRSAFDAAGLASKIDVGIDHNIYDVISYSDTPTGSHQASNAFGAKATIMEIERVMKVIFDREASDYSDQLFPDVVGELALSPAEAQALKPKLKLAFVVTPKEPYLVRGRRKYGTPTIQNQRDITENYSILIADIQCGLLTDAKNRVLGSYPAAFNAGF